MSAVLFSCPPFLARVMGSDDVPELQRFFEANPEYFLATTGEAPGEDAARGEFEEGPPAGWPFGRKYMIRFDDGRGDMVASAEVISDLLADGVWHIGLFVVCTRLHGGGAAGKIHACLETWMRSSGAKWLRLGVVEGNARAERFWKKSGYLETRKREGVVAGRQVNTVRVLVKPLANGRLKEYLALVARDRPGAP